MFPPPTTTATVTPALRTSAICSAIARVVLTSTPDSSAENASPEIFSSTRENRGPFKCMLFSECVFREAAHPDLLAERTDRAVNQVAYANRIVLHEGLIE